MSTSTQDTLASIGCWIRVILVLTLIFGTPSLAFYLLHPGGPLNQHDWMSDHMQYVPCGDASQTNTQFSMIVQPCGGQYKPLVFRLEAVPGYLKPSPVVKPGCWVVDFCLKHSEVKVSECPKGAR